MTQSWRERVKHRLSRSSYRLFTRSRAYARRLAVEMLLGNVEKIEVRLVGTETEAGVSCQRIFETFFGRATRNNKAFVTLSVLCSEEIRRCCFQNSVR